MKDILDIEALNFESLMNFSFTSSKYSIWPVVRNQVMTLISPDTTCHNKMLTIRNHSVVQKIAVGLNHLKYIYKYRMFSNKNKYNFLIMTPTSQYVEKNGIYVHRTFDYLEDLLENEVLCIDSMADSSPCLPRRHKNYCFYDEVYIIEEFYKKAWGFRNLNKDKNVIASFLAVVKDVFDIKNPDILYLEKILKDYSRKLLIHKKLINRILDKFNPRTIFIHAGVYGGDNSILIYECQKREIDIIELQHGIISRNNFRYQLQAETDSVNEFKKYIPKKIALFGEYFYSNVSVPVQKFVIGYPYFSQQKKKKKSELKTDDYGKTVVFLSQWTVTDINIEYARQMTELLPKEYNIYLRLHPREQLTQEQKKVIDSAEVKISTINNLYEEFSRAQHVVSVYSTSIYEAIGCGVNGYIIDCEYSRSEIDRNVGMWVKNPKQLATEISGAKEAQGKELFAANYRERYNDFINNIKVNYD